MKYAFITGATSGIGKDFARILGAMGYNLILIGRRKERLDYMYRFFTSKYGIDVVTYNIDLASLDDVKDLCKYCSEYDIQIVINCAGYGKLTDFNKSNLDDDMNMINLNVSSLHYLTSYFSRFMNSGYILNVASIAGTVPGPLMAQYGATKAYVLNYSIAASYELKKQHSDVNISVLCPGPVKSEFDKVAGCKGNINQISSMECAVYALTKMFEKKRIIIPGFITKLGYMTSKFAPVKLLLKAEYMIQHNKYKEKKNGIKNNN